MAEWMHQMLAGQPGFERGLVERYTTQLLQLARRQLPDNVRRRVDPEDVVQSVYRSFFRRLNDGQFSFEDSLDVWRLLATITCCKSQNLIKHHHRQRRDARRDRPLSNPEDSTATGSEPIESEPGPADVALLYDCLEQFLAALPDHCRQIVIRRLEGDSIDEIATRVNRSRRTVSRVLAEIHIVAAQQLESVP